MSKCVCLHTALGVSFSCPCKPAPSPKSLARGQSLMCSVAVVQSLSHVHSCDLVDCSTLGFPVLWYLLELGKTHVHWVRDAIQLSHPLMPPFPPALNSSQHQGLFQWLFVWLFTLSGQSIGVSDSASVLPMNIQDWFPLGLTGLISLQPKGLSRVFFSITAQKHQFFCAQLSL